MCDQADESSQRPPPRDQARSVNYRCWPGAQCAIDLAGWQCLYVCAFVCVLHSHSGHIEASSMATEGTVERQGHLKDVGERCRIRAESWSQPERGPRCRGRAENSTAEGDWETQHINNRAEISPFSLYSVTFASQVAHIVTSERKFVSPGSFSWAVQLMRGHILIRPTVIPPYRKRERSLYNKLPLSYRATLHSVSCHINVTWWQPVITCLFS